MTVQTPKTLPFEKNKLHFAGIVHNALTAISRKFCQNRKILTPMQSIGRKAFPKTSQVRPARPANAAEIGGIRLSHRSLSRPGVAILVCVAVVCCTQMRATADPTQWSATAEASLDVGSNPQGGAAKNVEAENLSLPRFAALTSRTISHGDSLPRLIEPFGLATTSTSANAFSAKWLELQARIRLEEKTLAACRTGGQPCPASARQFLDIVELGRRQQGRARLGAVNRAVDLSIRPMSDWAQYGIEAGRHRLRRLQRGPAIARITPS